MKDSEQDKKLVTKAVHKHEARLHPGKPKTKFAKGGKTNADMLSMGRNMAKIKNQFGRA
jgi:hypothetical protein